MEDRNRDVSEKWDKVKKLAQKRDECLQQAADLQTVAPGLPPTTTGLPRSSGFTTCSTETKKASRSICMIRRVIGFIIPVKSCH